MRESLIAAWALVALLFGIMSVGARLPAHGPALPPGVTIPGAGGTLPPIDPACAGGPEYAAESGC
jgi:hypothetical protein